MAEPTLVMTADDLRRAIIRHWKGDAAVRESSGSGAQSFTTGTVDLTPVVNLSSGTLAATLDEVPQGATPPFTMSGSLDSDTLPTWMRVDGVHSSAKVRVNGEPFEYPAFGTPGETEFQFRFDGETFDQPEAGPATVEFEFDSPESLSGSLAEFSDALPTWVADVGPGQVKLTVATVEYSVTAVFSSGGTFLQIADAVTATAATFSLDQTSGGLSSLSEFLSARESQIVDECLRSGYRRFLYPPPIPGEDRPHIWGFLTPTRTQTLNAPFTDGTIDVEGGVVTLAVPGDDASDDYYYDGAYHDRAGFGSWPAWADQGVLLIDGTPHEVVSRTSNTQLTIADTGLSVSDGTFTLFRSSYDLPDDFGSFLGALAFRHSRDRCHPPLINVGMQEFRERQCWGDLLDSDVLGVPRWYCVAPVKESQTSGQRYRLHIHPAPRKEHTIVYRYSLLPNALTVGTALHYGGSAHSETLLQACLAAWEELLEDGESTLHAAAFRERLQWSVHYDRHSFAPDNIGLNADHSDPYDDGCFDSHRSFRLRGHGHTTINVNL